MRHKSPCETPRPGVSAHARAPTLKLRRKRSEASREGGVKKAATLTQSQQTNLPDDIRKNLTVKLCSR